MVLQPFEGTGSVIGRPAGELTQLHGNILDAPQGSGTGQELDVLILFITPSDNAAHKECPHFSKIDCYVYTHTKDSRIINKILIKFLGILSISE